MSDSDRDVAWLRRGKQPPEPDLTLPRETADAIAAHTRKHGVPPTMRQLADALGLSSVSGAHDRVRKAVDAGLIEQVGPRKFLVVSE